MGLNRLSFTLYKGFIRAAKKADKLAVRPEEVAKFMTGGSSKNFGQRPQNAVDAVRTEFRSPLNTLDAGLRMLPQVSVSWTRP